MRSGLTARVYFMVFEAFNLFATCNMYGSKGPLNFLLFQPYLLYRSCMTFQYVTVSCVPAERFGLLNHILVTSVAFLWCA